MPPVEPPVKPTSTDTASAQTVRKPSLKERFTALVKNYGPVAIIVHVILSLLSFTGFVLAIRAGLNPQELAQKLGITSQSTSGTAETAGTFVGAYVMYKAVQVPRIFVTLVLTPLVARIPFVTRFIRRFQEEKR